VVLVFCRGQLSTVEAFQAITCDSMLGWINGGVGVNGVTSCPAWPLQRRSLFSLHACMHMSYVRVCVSQSVGHHI